MGIEELNHKINLIGRLLKILYTSIILYGKALTEYVISHHQVTKVDVNEQNPQAIGFYKKMGFHVTKRNPLTSQGNPFSDFGNGINLT